MPAILIVGVGSIGTRHVRNLLSLGYNNLATCDPLKEKLEAVSRFGADRTYEDVRVALETEKPDIVFICNPTHLHISTAVLALRFGTHVFIEKPISHTLQGIDALERVAKKKKKIVMVACNFRFSKGFQKLESVLRKQTFGTPLFVRVAVGYYLPTARKGVSYKNIYAARTQGGGVVLDSGSHVVDYLTALFGKVKASKMVKGTMQTIGIESEETAILALKHESGVLSSVTLDYVSRKPTHTIEVVTDRGTLLLDLKEDTLTYEDARSKKVLYTGDGDVNDMFCEELKHFMKCVTGGAQPRQDIGRAEEVLRTLLAIKAQ